jgi:hypothetical protein
MNEGSIYEPAAVEINDANQAQASFSYSFSTNR